MSNERDCPTGWFFVLERAILSRDLIRAKEAERNLHRLGVSVSFAPSRALVLQSEEEARLARPRQ